MRSSEAESDFCFPVSNLLPEKYARYSLETKFLASFTHICFSICSKSQFGTEDIETIAECFDSKFESFALSRLGWLLRFKIENGRTTSGFPISVVFIYTKNTSFRVLRFGRC